MGPFLEVDVFGECWCEKRQLLRLVNRQRADVYYILLYKLQSIILRYNSYSTLFIGSFNPCESFNTIFGHGNNEILFM